MQLLENKAMQLVENGRDSYAIWVACSAVALVNLIAVLVVGNSAWDDGAITLSYARTFAEYGVIALTPYSPQAEGATSVLWFFLLSVLHSIFGFDFDSSILSAQLLSAACTVCSTAILARMLSVFVNTRVAAAFSALTFSCASFLNESMNGMEMSMLTLLLLLVVRAASRDAHLQLVMLAGLTVLARPESAVYLIFGAAALLVGRNTRSAGSLVAGASVALAGMTAWRLIVFGTVVPNSILAKRWYPYSHDGLEAQVRSSLSSGMEALTVILPAILLISVLSISAYRNSGRLRFNHAEILQQVRNSLPQSRFSVGLLLGYVFLNIYLGRNWGYDTRMYLGCFPLAMIVAASFCRGRLVAAKGAALVAYSSGILVVSVMVLQWPNLVDGATGSQGTRGPAHFQRMGLTADALRIQLGEDVLTLMTPDVGGASLCCENLEIIDIGLLGNSQLAKGGWAELPSVLKESRPTLIETHGIWSRASAIYDLPYFSENYVPVVINGRWLHIRRDRHSDIVTLCQWVDASEPRWIYRGEPIDESYVRASEFGQICRLNVGGG
jgi:hypothetical protein